MTTAQLSHPTTSRSTVGEVDEILDPSKETRVHLLWKIGQLQMLPSLALKALDLVKRPDCSIRQFSALIKRDMTLAADMLKMANSMVYSRGLPIPSLTRAVSRLGLDQCKNLIIASSANSLMVQLTMTETWIREALWRHGFLTAKIASGLNQELSLGFQGEEFTSGLIHDIGRILMAVLNPDRFALSDKLDCQEGGEATQQELLQREHDLFGTTHCSLGGWFVEYSGLPQSLADVVRFHHTYSDEMADRPLVALTALTALADHMANHMQMTKSADGYDPEFNPALDYLATSHSKRDMLIKWMPKIMTEAVSVSR